MPPVDDGVGAGAGAGAGTGGGSARPHSAAGDRRGTSGTEGPGGVDGGPRSWGVGTGAGWTGSTAAGGAVATGGRAGSPSASITSRISACTAEDQWRSSPNRARLNRSRSALRTALRAATISARAPTTPTTAGRSQISDTAVTVLPEQVSDRVGGAVVALGRLGPGIPQPPAPPAPPPA